MADSFEIQSEAQARTVENRKIMQESFESIASNISNVNTSEVADQVVNQLYDTINLDNSIDLTNIEEKIDNIDTEILQAQIQDVIIQLNTQQERINSIDDKLNAILDKISS